MAIFGKWSVVIFMIVLSGIIHAQQESRDNVIGNHNRSIQEWKVLAVDGDEKAQFHLAEGYFKGTFEKKNIKEAVKWYSLAAKSGFALAQVKLAYLYRHGIGVRKNVVEALVWYQKAAKQGSQRAQIALGIMYQSGIDMDISFKDAAFWYMQVIGSTSKNGQEMASKVPYSVPQTNRDVALIYLEAARRGIISAQWGLGLLCNYGIGFEADQSLAMALQRLAEMNADQLDKPYIKANVAILRSSMTVETNRVADEWISKGLAKVLQQVDLSLRKTAMDYGR